MRSPFSELFREVWERTGPDKMTRQQIANHFNKSLYWVQWMFVKTGVAPRNQLPAVRARTRTGVDKRIEYIDAMQRKSALILLTKKLVKRTKALEKTPALNKSFGRKISDMRRSIATAERHLQVVIEDDPQWDRLFYPIKAIGFAKIAYNNACGRCRGKS